MRARVFEHSVLGAGTPETHSPYLVRRCKGPAWACGVAAPLRSSVSARSIWWQPGEGGSSERRQGHPHLAQPCATPSPTSPNTGCPCSLQCCLEGPGSPRSLHFRHPGLQLPHSLLARSSYTSSWGHSVTSNRHPSTWPGPCNRQSVPPCGFRGLVTGRMPVPTAQAQAGKPVS